MISWKVGYCGDERRGTVYLVTGWKEGPICRHGWVLQEGCRASWKPDVSILAHRISRGEKRKLYLSQHYIAVASLD